MSLILPSGQTANNYVQMEWLDQSQNASSRWATSADFPDVGSVRIRCESNGSASHYEVLGSDTGALESALWSLLGNRGVDVLAWENFGKDWVIDVVDELKICLL